MRIFIILIAIFLGSCVSSPKIEPSIVVTKKMIYPNIPDIKVPAKSELEDVKFDWPRLNDHYSIKNNKKCKKTFTTLYPGENPLSFKLNLNNNTEFWRTCSVLSIDHNSNLYIGLTEEEYKKLINNMNKLMTREKKWRSLLDSVNGTFSDWREKNKQSGNSK